MIHKNHRPTSISPAHTHEHMVRDLQQRFWVSTLLSIPVLILSPFIQSLLGLQISFPGSNLLITGIATIIFFYGGKPFLWGLVEELKKKRPGMMTLVGIAITAAYLYSLAVVFGLPGKQFFWELVTLIDIMLLGHWLEMRSVLGASQATEKLAQLLPATAHVIQKDGTITDIPINNLKKGTVVLVRPGEKVSADGIVISGESTVNEAALTGESTPIVKKAGTTVIAGSLNEHGSLTIEVQKEQTESYIAQVINLVQQVMKSKSHAQDLANRAAFILTVISLSAGLITLVIWLFLRSTLSFALERTVSVMVTACPHALGLAIPLVIAVVAGYAARKGLLIRNRVAFEDAQKITIVVFDKTGTLTYGVFTVTDIISLGTLSEQELLTLAASIERYGKHPISVATSKKAEELQLPLKSATAVKTIPGKGITATVDSTQFFIGNLKLFADTNIPELELDRAGKQLASITQKGKTAALIGTANKIEGIIAASDVIRPESYKACKKLKERGITVAMITGDNMLNAKAIAKELGIDLVLAEVLPDQKATEIEKLQKKYTVAMVGDGINDAPALVAADIGIAIGAGTDVAIESADIILVQSDPSKVVDLIDLSRASKRKMFQNLFWATGYNIIALPLAAGALYFYGIMITPAIGALLMSLSTVIVAINARLLKV